MIPIVGDRPVSAGIGLRDPHFSQIIEETPSIPWLEALTDNYLYPIENRRQLLEIREHYPMTLHGVGMSLGSVDPLNMDYLNHLRLLIRDLKPAWVSEHLCWTSMAGQYLHELMPLPYTEEAIFHLAGRIKQVQDFLEMPLVLENVSSYIRFDNSTMSEAQFFASVLQESDCLALLDINNVYVSATNHGFDAMTYLNEIPVERVQEIHLGGHSVQSEGFLLDTHGAAIAEPVWTLYEKYIAGAGNIPTLIEWDNDIPALDRLLSEAERAAQILEQNREREYATA